MTSVQQAEAPELEISFDLVRRGLYVAPVVIGGCALIWGADGARGALVGLAIVLGNFVLAAASMAVAARISLAVLMGAVLFGLLVRLGVILAVVLLVRDATWISLEALGATIIISHLGLLVWELKHVSISLAHSGVKPSRP